jgi:CRP-like cAMP-binding protein
MRTNVLGREIMQPITDFQMKNINNMKPLLYNDLYTHCISFIENLSPVDWIAIEKYVQRVNYSKGDILIRENDIVQNFIITGSGFYMAYYKNQKEQKFIQEFHTKHDFMAPINELSLTGKSPVTIECLKNGHCYKISWNALEIMAKSEPNFMDFRNGLISRQYAEQSTYIKDLVTLSMSERLEKLKVEKPDVMLNITQKHIANYLGITPVALSRLLNTGKTSA